MPGVEPVAAVVHRIDDGLQYAGFDPLGDKKVVLPLESVTASIEERLLVLARGEGRHTGYPFRMSAQDGLAAAANGQFVSADRNTPLRPNPADA